MGMPNGEAVAERLNGIPEYPANFKKAFPGEKDPVTFDNFAKAVAAYLSSKERPQMSGLEKDYPKLEIKAVDCPYPPYADDFS